MTLIAMTYKVKQQELFESPSKIPAKIKNNNNKMANFIALKGTLGTKIIVYK